MRGKRLTERRQRIQAIEQAEAKARCAHCRRSFAEAGQIIESLLDDRQFCSDECLYAATKDWKPRGFQRMGS